MEKYLDALGPVGALLALANVGQFVLNRKDSDARWKTVGDLTAAVGNLNAAVGKLTDRLMGGGK